MDGDDDEAADILAEASAAKAGLRRHPMATAAAEPSDTEYKLDTLERLTRLPPARIPEALDEAARWLETDRPFYVRSDRVLKKLMDMPADQVPSEAQSERDEDAGVLERFREIGARIICDIAASSGGRARILTYAKSVHVVEALKGVPREIQEESTLYVAECRSKARRFDVTEASFADARGLLEDLEETAYDTLLVIDSDAAGLLASRSKEIDLVVLGAQEIQTEDGRPAHFVNTPGTDALVRVARDCNTPVYVLVPDDPEKFTVVSDFNPPRKFDDPPWPSEDAGPVLRRTKLLRLKSERIQIDPARIHVYTENGLLTTRDDSASDAA